MQGTPSNGLKFYLPWLAGMLLALLFALVVMVIVLVLASVLVHWIKDSHIHPSGHSCKDGDPCTKDYQRQGGGCVYDPQPDGHKCHSNCFNDEPEESPFSSHRCEYERSDPFGEWTDKSKCVGTQCKGNCLLTSECPDFTFRDGVEALTTKDCDSFACYYFLDLEGENEDMDLQCFHDSRAYIQLCLKKLNTSDPIVADHCLVAEPACNPEEQDIVGCYYFFRCGCPTEEIPLIVKNTLRGGPSFIDADVNASPMNRPEQVQEDEGNRIGDASQIQEIQQMLDRVDNKVPGKIRVRHTRRSK